MGNVPESTVGADAAGAAVGWDEDVGIRSDPLTAAGEKRLEVP